jgi:transcriptional regulator of acetoin/glycerol metabolism
MDTALERRCRNLAIAAGRVARAALRSGEKDVAQLVLDTVLPEVICAALNGDDHYTRAARRLGINRNTLRKYRRRYGITG